MSIDIDWEGLTAGPEGLELAESIKDFIHAKFQQVQLPRFIRSVQVHSFDFGEECPVVDLKDICDPLPEFYEDEEGDSEDDGHDTESNNDSEHHSESIPCQMNQGGYGQTQIPDRYKEPMKSGHPVRPMPLDTRFTAHRPNLSLVDHITSPFLSRSNTPGIPGGTSNLSYFHLPLSAGLSGTQTPLAAVAGGNSLSGRSETVPPESQHLFRQRSPIKQRQSDSPLHNADLSSRPSTSDSYNHLHGESQGPEDTLRTSRSERIEPDPSDMQIVLHISYKGSIRLSITAEILLDYPMPSFVGIPLKLNITGLSFDGVALIAYLRKRAHFCFLAPDDARTLIGTENAGYSHNDGQPQDIGSLGGLLREIQVESEIGRQEGGKQVLKNVGKVEKFVLEQVRRIFEDEFVWPSFWTFLV